MKLEKATAADIPAVVALMNRAYRGGGETASWNSEAAIIGGDRTNAAQLSAEIAEKPHAVLLVNRSEDAARIEGNVWLEPLEDGVWYLGSLTVDPTLQNSGAGRRLLEAAEAWVDRHGGRTVRMTVVNVREALIAWYLRRGYRLTGETQPFPYDNASLGVPKRDDLSFVVLERTLTAAR